MADIRGGSTIGGIPILGKEANENYIGKIKGNSIVDSILSETGGVLKVEGNISFDGTATSTNQDRGIFWTAFDKEAIGDASDLAHIKHTTNSGGLTGSVIEIKSHNDATDGVNFVVNAADGVRINGNAIYHAGNKPATSNLADIPTSIILGRATAGTGVVEQLTATQVRTLLNVADGANNYVHPTTDGNKHIPSGGSSGNILQWSSAGTAVWKGNGTSGQFLAYDGSWATPTGTYSHPTYTQASSDNSNGTVIQDITLTNGHVTGIGTVDLDGRYYTETESDNRFLRASSASTIDVNSLSLGTQLYNGSSGTWTNRHTTGDNSTSLLSMNTHSGNYYSQLWFDTQGDNFYHRTIHNGTLRTWRKIFHEGNLTTFGRSINGLVPGAPAGTGTTKYLREDGAWVAPPDTDTDTNNYLTGVSGSGNGTVTFTRLGLSDLTWNASHNHDNSYVLKSGDTMTGALNIGSRDFSGTNTWGEGNMLRISGGTVVSGRSTHYHIETTIATSETDYSNFYLLLFEKPVSATGEPAHMFTGRVSGNRSNDIGVSFSADVVVSTGWSQTIFYNIEKRTGSYDLDVVEIVDNAKTYIALRCNGKSGAGIACWMLDVDIYTANIAKMILKPVVSTSDLHATLQYPSAQPKTIYNNVVMKGDMAISGDITVNGNDLTFASAGTIHKVGAITFDWTGSYDNVNEHGITSRGETGTASDSLRINSYNNIINTIDSNNNDTTSYYKVQHHSAGGDGEDLFWVRSSDGYGYVKANFGIGTTTPGEMLDVNGNVKASSYKVGTTTIIDSSRNLTNAGTGAFAGAVTITSSGALLSLKKSAAGTGNLWMNFRSDTGTEIAWMGYGGGVDDHFSITNTLGDVILSPGTGIAKVGSNTIWHTGNDGSGSGLDADTIDSIDSTRLIYGQNASGVTSIADTTLLWKSGFYDVSSSATAPTSNEWYWIMNAGHTLNSTTYRYNGQMAFRNGTSEAYIRTTSGSGTYTQTPWAKIWTDQNFTPSTKADLTGANFTGRIEALKNIGANPATIYDTAQIEATNTDGGVAAISLHRSGNSHAALVHKEVNKLHVNMNSGEHEIYHTGNLNPYDYKMSRLENVVTVGSNGTTNISIGIGSYNSAEDLLEVFQDNIRLYKTENWILNANNTSIDLVGYSADAGSKFLFTVHKKVRDTIATNVDGATLINNTVTPDKLKADYVDIKNTAAGQTAKFRIEFNAADNSLDFTFTP